MLYNNQIQLFRLEEKNQQSFFHITHMGVWKTTLRLRGGARDPDHGMYVARNNWCILRGGPGF